MRSSSVRARPVTGPTRSAPPVPLEPSTPSVENRDLSRCVAAAVGKVHFPEVFDVLADGTRAYGDRTSVRYRFRFKPAKRKRGPRPLARRGRLRGLDPLDEVLARGGLSKGIKPPKLRSLQPVFRRAPGASQPQPQPPPPPGVGPSGKPPTVKNAKGDDPLQGIDLDSP